LLKAERRFSGGLTFQWSYTFAKLLTDSDSYFATGGSAQDQYNRRPEKSIGAFDQTHVVKLGTIYELPFGPGKRFLSSGFASRILGGWRISDSDLLERVSDRFDPQQLCRFSTCATRPISTFDGWRDHGQQL
jgi:hypothetical protein